MEEFVESVHGQIERYTAGHEAERSFVTVELADSSRLVLKSLSAEPGHGFVTLSIHPDEDDPTEQVIVPVMSIRRISLGPAEEERVRFGFSLPGSKPAG